MRNSSGDGGAAGLGLSKNDTSLGDLLEFVDGPFIPDASDPFPSVINGADLDLFLVTSDPSLEVPQFH